MYMNQYFLLHPYSHCLPFHIVYAPLQTEVSQLQSEKDELAASKDAIVAEISMLQVGSIWSGTCTVHDVHLHIQCALVCE